MVPVTINVSLRDGATGFDRDFTMTVFPGNVVIRDASTGHSITIGVYEGKAEVSVYTESQDEPVNHFNLE